MRGFQFTGTRGELAGPDWIEIITIKFIAKYLLFPSQILFYLILDLQSGHGVPLGDRLIVYITSTSLHTLVLPTLVPTQI